MTLTQLGRKKCVQHHGRICRQRLDRYAPFFSDFYYIVREDIGPKDHLALAVRFKGRPHIFKGDYKTAVLWMRMLLDIDPTSPFHKLTNLVGQVLCQTQN